MNGRPLTEVARIIASYLTQALGLLLLVAFSRQLPNTSGMYQPENLGVSALAPFALFMLGWGARRDEDGGWPQLISLLLLLFGGVLGWARLPIAGCMVHTILMVAASALVVFAEPIAPLLHTRASLMGSTPPFILRFAGLLAQAGLIYWTHFAKLP